MDVCVSGRCRSLTILGCFYREGKWRVFSLQLKVMKADKLWIHRTLSINIRGCSEMVEILVFTEKKRRSASSPPDLICQVVSYKIGKGTL